MAVVLTAVLLWVIVLAWRDPALRRLAGLLLGALLLQIGLGISNVLYSLPLPVAIAHNGGAALLLIVLLVLIFRVRHRPGNGVTAPAAAAGRV